MLPGDILNGDGSADGFDVLRSKQKIKTFFPFSKSSVCRRLVGSSRVRIPPVCRLLKDRQASCFLDLECNGNVSFKFSSIRHWVRLGILFKSRSAVLCVLRWLYVLNP